MRDKSSTVLKINYSVICIMVLLVNILQFNTRSEAGVRKSDFKLLHNRFLLSLSHTGYLGLSPAAVSDGKMLYFIRKSSPKSPGDYLVHPWLADSSEVSNVEKAEIDSLLNQFISPEYFNRTILDSLTDYDYLISDGAVNRHEFYVRYAEGETIYTISGWYGKFVSFLE